MRLIAQVPPILILSERNVRALYHKLTKPGSAREFIGPQGSVIVRIEDDAIHYAQRDPGMMSSDTEAFIKKDTTKASKKKKE